MPIQAFQLTNFFIEDLFHAEALEVCETATDEVVTYNNNQTSTCISSNDTKRWLFPEESEDASYQPLIRACSVTDTSMLIHKGEFNRRKREKQKEVEWKKYGHLSRPSTKWKYIGNSQGQKASCTVSDLPTNQGGYTSKASRFKNHSKIQSLDKAMALGFVLVKSSDLYVYKIIVIACWPK